MSSSKHPTAREKVPQSITITLQEPNPGDQMKYAFPSLPGEAPIDPPKQAANDGEIKRTREKFTGVLLLLIGVGGGFMAKKVLDDYHAIPSSTSTPAPRSGLWWVHPHKTSGGGSSVKSPSPSPVPTAPSAPSGCNLYPKEPVCRLGSPSYNNQNNCFAVNGTALPLSSFFIQGVPNECNKNGPFIGLEELSGETLTPVTLPGRFPKVETKGVTAKSALLALHYIGTANGNSLSGHEAAYLASLVPEGISKEEMARVSEIIAVYNAVLQLHRAEVLKIRAKIVAECAKYAGNPLVPLRCVAANQPLPPDFELTPKTP